MAIPREMAPDGVESDLSSFLNRLVINVDNELEKSSILPMYAVLPPRPTRGKLYYFINPVLPEITEEGIWIYKAGAWKLVA